MTARTPGAGEELRLAPASPGSPCMACRWRGIHLSESSRGGTEGGGGGADSVLPAIIDTWHRQPLVALDTAGLLGLLLLLIPWDRRTGSLNPVRSGMVRPRYSN